MIDVWSRQWFLIQPSNNWPVTNPVTEQRCLRTRRPSVIKLQLNATVILLSTARRSFSEQKYRNFRPFWTARRNQFENTLQILKVSLFTPSLIHSTAIPSLFYSELKPIYSANPSNHRHFNTHGSVLRIYFVRRLLAQLALNSSYTASRNLSARVCMCVNQGGPNHNRCTQRLVILHGNPYTHPVPFCIYYLTDIFLSKN